MQRSFSVQTESDFDGFVGELGLALVSAGKKEGSADG